MESCESFEALLKRQIKQQLLGLCASMTLPIWMTGKLGVGHVWSW